MSFIRRVLGIDDKSHKEHAQHMAGRARETEQSILAERQEYRQTIQRVESGARVLATWDGAMRMMTRDKE